MDFMEALGISALGLVIVFAALAALMAVITVMAKLMNRPEKAVAAPAAEAAAPQPAVPAGPIVAQCRLTDCDEKSAAMIIAIVADMLGDEFEGQQVVSIRQI